VIPQPSPSPSFPKSQSPNPDPSARLYGGKGRNCQYPVACAPRTPPPSRRKVALPPPLPWPVPCRLRPAPPRVLVAIMTRVGTPDLLSGGACRACSPLAKGRTDQRPYYSPSLLMRTISCSSLRTEISSPYPFDLVWLFPVRK
jgi:hypothetical protein